MINYTNAEDDIHIIDGIFSHKEVSELQLYAENKKNYSMCGDASRLIYTFAATDDKDNFDDVQKNILKKFEEKLNFKIPVFNRIITNCFGINDFCDRHVDDPKPDGVTFLLYCNKEWHNHWSGETYFLKDENAVYNISVLPKPGRLVVTPSYILHGSRAPSQFIRCKGRITMAFQSDSEVSDNWYINNKINLKKL